MFMDPVKDCYRNCAIDSIGHSVGGISGELVGALLHRHYFSIGEYRCLLSSRIRKFEPKMDVGMQETI
jgi:hypothetical protein